MLCCGSQASQPPLEASNFDNCVRGWGNRGTPFCLLLLPPNSVYRVVMLLLLLHPAVSCGNVCKPGYAKDFG
jgi:hypothetical protein